MVRSQLDYCSSVWAPYKSDIEMLEKVQKGATKLIPELTNMVYWLSQIIKIANVALFIYLFIYYRLVHEVHDRQTIRQYKQQKRALGLT